MPVNGNNHCVVCNGKISAWKTLLVFENSLTGLSSRLPTENAIRQTGKMTEVAILRSVKQLRRTSGLVLIVQTVALKTLKTLFLHC